MENESYRSAWETIAETARAMCEVVWDFAKAVAQTMKVVPPRVQHLALHGKKYRTRKKNENRMLRELKREVLYNAKNT